jgi:uncharacterized protein YdcH (DUF465 family)
MDGRGPLENVMGDSQTEELLEQLRAEHRAIEMRLAELEGHLSLTPAEQVERSELKKLKLAKKDQMARLSRPSPAPGRPS